LYAIHLLALQMGAEQRTFGLYFSEVKSEVIEQHFSLAHNLHIGFDMFNCNF
jgi:hypothetical protein